MHGFKRILGVRHILLQQIDGWRVVSPKARRLFICPYLFNVDQQIGQSAFDRIQMVEAGVRRTQALDQLSDTVFEMPKRDLIGARLLNLLDLLGQ